MSVTTDIDEARYRRYRQKEIDPITAKAEEEDVSPEELLGMVDKILNLGAEREKQLEEVIPVDRDGSFRIPYCAMGTYSDFDSMANHEFFKQKYPWLHDVGEGLGIDDYKAAETHDSLERFLATIPHEDWEAFLEYA